MGRRAHSRKLFLRLREELPYSTHVEVKEMKEQDNGTVYVQAVVYTNQDRYKRMIVAPARAALKRLVSRHDANWRQ